MSQYKKGDWWATCDVCGREYYATSLRKRWDGYMVCKDDYEPRHPQDFVRGVADTQVPPWTRPEPADTFNPDVVCGLLESTSTPGLAEPGCMVPGATVPSWYTTVPPSTFTP